MLSDPRVSACIVLYRTGEEALNAVRCVQDATEPVTLFVVDNAPKDSVADQIARQCRGAKIISMERNVGYGQGNNGTIKVKVTKDGDKITAIEVLDHLETPSIFEEGVKIIDAMIAANSPDVDTITGATNTSNGIIAAVKDALK